MTRTALLALLFSGLATALGSTAAQAQNGVSCGSGGSAKQLESVILTTDQRLLCYREGSNKARILGTIAGLNAGETLVGIDYRPANGMLYGMGSLGGVYSLASASGTVTATLVSTAVDIVAGTPIVLSGTSFGVDFNPVPDRLRIVSDAGQNLRINVDTGQTNVDGALNVAGAPTLGVTAAAYTNNDADAGTLTVLNVLNTNADQLVIQAPPNAGTQNPVGALRVDSGAATGFDIFSTIKDGTTVALRGLALLPSTAADGTTSTQLYKVNLASGAVTPTKRGNFGALPLLGLAIPLTQGK